MSQATRAMRGSWGLTVGWNSAPPPPGPRVRQRQRCSPGAEVIRAKTTATTRVSRLTIIRFTERYPRARRSQPLFREASKYCIHPERALGITVDREVLPDTLESPMSHVLSQPPVPCQLLDRVCERRCIVWRGQQARLLLLYHFRERPAAASDNGNPAGHRLRQHQPERLAHRGQEEDI